MKYLLALLVLAGCDTTDPTTFATAPVTNDRGQTMTFVAADLLHGWMAEHKDVKIVALTGYSYGGKASTEGYVIVYEVSKVEK